MNAQPTPEDKVALASDRFDNLVRQLDDVIPNSQFVASAILELIRAEIDRVNSTGKICP